MISEISLRGSGSVEGKAMLISNSISLTSKDSGEIEVSGKAKKGDANTTGSGDLKGKELIADQAEIYISGSGSSSIFVNNSLTGKIKGSGGILYGGNPSTNDVKVFDSGKVKSI